MSDNSPSHHSEPVGCADGHTRPNSRPKTTNPIGRCLCKAFDDADLEQDNSGSLGKLLKMLD